MKRFFVVITILLILIGAISTVAYQFILTNYWQSFGRLDKQTEVFIESGASSQTIITTLHEQGIITDPLLFRFFATFFGDITRYKAGEYRFNLYVSPSGVSTMLVEGKTIQRSVTIPEGWVTTQIIDALNAEPLLTGNVTALPAEGSLLPETYFYVRGQNRTDIITQMQRAMNNVIAQEWANRQEGLPLKTPEEAVILASIVEKETGAKEERERVAAVFINRLRAKMPLQSDPTANYGIYLEQGALKTRMLRADVAHESPYNTYVINGLPPTPICHAGRASLHAVLHPADTDDLYFVADGKGGHVFAVTLNDHNRNVAEYRKMQRLQVNQKKLKIP